MNLAFLQLPMVLFTTLAPMASGAFIGLAIAFLTTRFSSERLARIDRWTLLPLGILAVGFAAALASFALPARAAGVLQSAWLGSMPLVLLASLLFVLVAVAYWVVAMMGVLTCRARVVFSSVLAVGALALSFFIGAAYWGSAVSSWASPVAAVGVAGFCAAGGVPLGVLVVALGGGMTEAQDARFSSASMVAAFVGVVAAIFAVASQMLYAQSVVSAFFPGAEALPGSWVYLAISIAGFVVMLVCLRTALSPDRAAAFGRTAGAAAAVPMRDRAAVRPENAARSAVSLLVGGSAAVLVAIFVARLVFYALQV